MRIDLPQCNLKNCIWCFDGNCTSKNKNTYEHCEYQLDKALIEHLKEDNLILKQQRVNLFERLEIIHDTKVKTAKEFAAKLKEYIQIQIDVSGDFELYEVLKDIDDLTAEFAGETK